MTSRIWESLHECVPIEVVGARVGQTACCSMILDDPRILSEQEGLSTANDDGQVKAYLLPLAVQIVQRSRVHLKPR